MVSPAVFLLKLAEKFGDVIQFKLGPFKVVLISNPAIIKEILIGQVKLFPKSKRDTDILSKAVGNGIVTADQQTHKLLRKVAQPSFMQRRIVNYQTIFEQYAQDCINDLNHADTINIAKEMERLSLQITCKTLFGLDKDDLKRTTEVSNAINELHALISKDFDGIINLPAWFPSPLNLRFKRARKVIDDIVEEIILNRRSMPFEDHGDLLSSFLEATDEAGHPLTNENIKDHLISYFIVGHETTSNTLLWSWYCLAKFEDQAEKVYQEVRNMKTVASINLSDYPKTHTFIKEVLRFFPPVWLIGARRVAEHVAINGYQFNKKDKVFISPFVVHRLDAHFNNASIFDASRWEDDVVSYEKGAYIPFGAGHRNCIGQHFALQEILTILVTITQSARFEFIDKSTDPIHIHARASLSNYGGMMMKINKKFATA
ncbi:cytochrome P450 [Pseudoalteromonas sp. SMS1]|uniref:cytochrome P450 n=1 Tax=Pseudoalteromonas sp. SMS1 TaxID=2908894 RepID=UPI001F413496|nr:cytochrome P450 [Pseudoalteromonas sp. SMS1]MCF2858799.1 cytochrome P450 [Pseudoalteromonas sp. SMS1]